MLSFLFTKTPLFFFTQSFWRDEAFSYLVAKRGIVDLLTVTAKDFNPPFYYLFLHYWMKLFGSSEISMRTVSFIFYWLTIYVAYLFIRNIFQIKTGRLWLYLILVSASPILLYYAFEARMYTMLAFFATSSFYFFLRKNYKGFFITTLLGLYMHYFMVFVIMAELLYYYVIYKRRITWKNLLYYGAPFLFFVPWLIFVLNVKDFGQPQYWIEKTSVQTFLNLIGILYTGYDSGLRFYHDTITKLSLGLTVILIAGCLFIWKKGNPAGKKILLYLFIWAIGIPIIVALISFFVPTFFPRYLIFSSIGFLLLLIYILERIPPTVRYVSLLLLSLITFNFHIQQVRDRKKSDLRRIFKEIMYLAKPDDVIYVTDELDYFVAQYYFDENRVYIYGKTYEEVPNYTGKVLMPRSKFVYTLPIYPKKAFVLVSDSRYEIQSAR